MAYTKQTWATGDTITAEKLNHMEDGIAENSIYDIVFSMGETLEATGLPFNELKTKIINHDLKALYIGGNGFANLIWGDIDVVGDLEYLGFCFMMEQKLTCGMANNGAGGIEYADGTNIDMTWTYDSATKTYTFTPSND